MPPGAKTLLLEYGSVLELSTSGIAYEAISGHPDIFFCLTPKGLVAAPNLPQDCSRTLNKRGIKFSFGDKAVGPKYPESAHYNAVISENFLIHRLDISDPGVLRHSETLEKINVKQGYCRCNLIPLKDDHFITSDLGIYNALSENGLTVLYVLPDNIILPGFPNGFLGGTCGVWEDDIFFAGSLDYLSQADELRAFLRHLGYNIVELYEGPLFDAGSILFIE